MDPKIRNGLGVAGIVAALLIGFAAMSYSSTYSKSIQPSTFRSFSASGEGRVVGIPDIAEFTFSVITEGGNDVASLQKQNIDKVNKSIAFVKSQGVDAKDIRTQNYNLNPRYQGYSCPASRNGEVVPCPPAQIVGYTIMQTVSVKVRDFSKTGTIIAGVVSNGANSTSQLNFRIDDPTEVQAKAREEAIAKAKAKAEAIARAGGFRIGRLLAIEEGSYFPPIYYSRDAKAGSTEATPVPAPSIEPGSEEVVVTVNLRYEIE